MNSELIHLSFYRFFRMGDETALAKHRANLKAVCQELGLKGTILLASEGVNAMVSGTRQAIDQFKSYIQETLGVDNHLFKEGNVPVHAFERMLVKIKKEIISVGDTELRPDEQTAQRISPAELKLWLDQKKPMILLDTRNSYEIEVGTFHGAEEFKLDSSRQFAQKAAENLDKLKDRPVVTFCTGGIRCEKASALLMKLGVKDVYQLDGGILRYFEENGTAHFDGTCFVFDWRLSVDGNLAPTARATEEDREFGRHRRFR
ncbi:MAG: rhodanese-like domain-containing protein [Oligoflexia bacterium]|nr:rhodanese-like domain-containing protein [Oligoflexia bacterium]